MNFFLILLFLSASMALLLFALKQRNQEGAKCNAALSADEQDYWRNMIGKYKKAGYIGAAGGLLSALAIAMKRAMIAEIGCLTLMASMVFALAILCRKTAFIPSEETKKRQKRQKTHFLIASFAALFLTQLVFSYFNSL